MSARTPVSRSRQPDRVALVLATGLAALALADGCGDDGAAEEPFVTESSTAGSTRADLPPDSATSGTSTGAGTSSSATSGSESGDDAGTSGDSTEGGSTTAANPPGYTPFFRIDCDDGALGERAEGPDALASVVGEENPKVLYSDEQAVDDVGQSCRTWSDAGQNFFGGRFLNVAERIADGDDLWMRQALFFPEGFCFGHGSTPGDGWGSTKWMRIEFDNIGPQGSPGDRLTLQLTNFAAEACNGTTSLFGATREYAGSANLRPDNQTAITPGQWHMIQWHVHLASDASGFVRFWVDDEFQGQVDDVTLGAPDRAVEFIAYGDYWNGSPFQDSEWFMDEVIMTTEPPSTLDDGGRPYIAPTARVNDWDAR